MINGFFHRLKAEFVRVKGGYERDFNGTFGMVLTYALTVEVCSYTILRSLLSMVWDWAKLMNSALTRTGPCLLQPATTLAPSSAVRMGLAHTRSLHVAAL